MLWLLRSSWLRTFLTIMIGGALAFWFRAYPMVSIPIISLTLMLVVLKCIDRFGDWLLSRPANYDPNGTSTAKPDRVMPDVASKTATSNSTKDQTK